MGFTNCEALSLFILHAIHYAYDLDRVHMDVLINFRIQDMYVQDKRGKRVTLHGSTIIDVLNQHAYIM